MIEYLAAAVGGYLLGSIPVGVIVGRVYRRVDIRDFGSGGTGSTNTLRTFGLGAAAIVLFFDVMKGVLPVLVARLLTDEPYVWVVAGVAAVLGHDFPVYVGFRGGKGVATSIGVMGTLLPWTIPIIIGAAIVLLVPFRIVSLMSIGGTPIIATIVLGFALHGDVDWAYGYWAIIATTLILVRHRANIRRLLRGEEPKIGQGGGRRNMTGSVAGR